MADIYTASVDGVALAAATAKTIIQLVTPATARMELLELDISLDGVTAAAVPGLVELITQTTAGTMSALTPTQDDTAAPASLVTAQHTATAEPTTGTLLMRKWRVSPYGGLGVFRFDGLKLNVSSRLGLRCTFAAIVNVTANLTYRV